MSLLCEASALPERIATNRPVGVRKSRSTNDQPINKWTYPVGQIKMVGYLPGLVEFRLNFGEYSFTWFHTCDSYVHRIEGFASLRTFAEALRISSRFIFPLPLTSRLDKLRHRAFGTTPVPTLRDTEQIGLVRYSVGEDECDECRTCKCRPRNSKAQSVDFKRNAF